MTRVARAPGLGGLILATALAAAGDADAQPTAPTAPFANDSAQGAQAGAASPASVSGDFTPEFSAIYNHTDGVDVSTSFHIQVSTDNTFATVTHWDSGSGGTTMAATGAGSRSPDLTYRGAPLSGFGTYYWRIRFFSSAAAASPYGAVSQFTVLPAPAVISAPPDGSTTSDPTPTLAGTVFAGATIEVVANTTSLGTVAADGLGNWLFTSPLLVDGLYVFRALASDGGGNYANPPVSGPTNLCQ